MRILLAPLLVLLFVNSANASSPVRQTLEVNGNKLALWEKRAPHPTRSIVLLHGRTWSSLPNFDLQVPGEKRSLMDALVAKGYAVYALDMPGYGGSPRDKSEWFTPMMGVEAVEQTLRWITKNSGVVARPVLFGWSNGATIAQLVAQRRPELLSDLVLFGYWRDLRVPIEKDQIGKGSLSQGAAPARKKNTAEAAAEDFIAPNVISKNVIDAYVQAALKSDPIRVDIRDNEQFNELDPKKVNVPTLLIQAALDSNSPTEVNAKLFAELATPDRQWVVLPGVDHAAFLEKMDPFVAAMVGFLERPQ
jgi:pimeloyl-ACP methyl ester carboxylesterase